MKLPLAFGGLDPHVLDDPMGALFADAVFDTLYALDHQGKPFPALAAALPEARGKGARIALRPELETAMGKSLAPEDVVFALRRSAQRGGMAWMSRFGAPLVDSRGSNAILIPNAKPKELALALASPITAILPRKFNRLRPDGTGAFRAHPARGRLTLERNEKAARGPAFLDRIEATQASSLSDALRAFESGEVDIGWLGQGLHQPRTGAKAFDAGRLGWIVLYTGARAGAWGRPGVAQRLLEELPSERLKHLGLRRPWPGSSGPGWGGPEGHILVDQASPQLGELAEALAALLSRPGHLLSVARRSRAELRAARRSKAFLLMVDFVRSISTSAEGTTAALYAAADPALARNPPRLRSDARTVARTLALGVLGELHAYGGHMPSLVGLHPWQLGSCWLTR